MRAYDVLKALQTRKERVSEAEGMTRWVHPSDPAQFVELYGEPANPSFNLEALNGLRWDQVESLMDWFRTMLSETDA